MATIGLVIRLLLRSTGFLGRLIGPALERTIVFAFIGLGWHVLPYFVVPVIIQQEMPPLEALRRSAAIIQSTWGSDVAVNAGVWLIFAAPLILAGAVAGPALTWATLTLDEWVVIGVAYALLVVTLLLKMARVLRRHRSGCRRHWRAPAWQARRRVGLAPVAA